MKLKYASAPLICCVPSACDGPSSAEQDPITISLAVTPGTVCASNEGKVPRARIRNKGSHQNMAFTTPPCGTTNRSRARGFQLLPLSHDPSPTAEKSAVGFPAWHELDSNNEGNGLEVGPPNRVTFRLPTPDRRSSERLVPVPICGKLSSARSAELD